MQPHQERVINEKAELDGRLSRLKDFIDASPYFVPLPQEEKDRLIKQSEIMGQYSDVLGQRIAAFS